MSTTTINQVPSVTLATDCDLHPRPTARCAVCPECAAVVPLYKLTPMRISHLEFNECPECSIGSLHEAWEKNIVSVKK